MRHSPVFDELFINPSPSFSEKISLYPRLSSILLPKHNLDYGLWDESKHLFLYDEIKHHEEDRTTEKLLDLPARGRFGEGRVEPPMDLARTLKNPSKTSILSKYESYP